MKSFCKIVLPAEAGTTFLKKCDVKSELKHEKHKRGNLKLAFLMQILIKVRPAQFFFSWLGTGYCFLKITKSKWMVDLGRPGGMRGGAGGDFERV